MLITRGFGTCTGGTGANVYVPIIDLVPTTENLGEISMQASVRIPDLDAAENVIEPPNMNTDVVDTDLDVSHLTPKITTNVPKV